MTKHTPTRSCVACRCKRPQSELIRFGRRADGEVTVTNDQSRLGRGAYCCPQADCIEKTVAKRLFQRSLRHSGNAKDEGRLRQEIQAIKTTFDTRHGER